MKEQKEGLKIVRTFNAPKEVVFDAFSSADAMAQWWGPAGSSITVKSFSFTAGGRFHYKLDGNNMVMWGLFNFQKIERPDLIEFISSFSDEDGVICSSPFPMDFPMEIFNQLTFMEENGKTTITLQGHPVNATAAQEATYYSIIPNMQQGFGGTFDQLDAYLAKTHK